MKAYIKPVGYRLTILSILLLFIGSGCSLTRRLKDNEALVRKITIKGVDKEFADAAVLYVDKEQQPNNVINLQFYYMFSKNGKKDIGEPPAILDSNLVEFSRTQIERFLQNKGYLKAKVADTIKIKKKKAELIFSATEGPLFKIRKIEDSIPDKSVQNLYRVNRPRFSHVQPGGRFDMDSLAFDRDEFYLIMKRNGYYDFYRQYINFVYDSTFRSSVVDIKMTIDNPAGRSSHPVYTINNTLVTVSKTNGRSTGQADTIQVDSQFRYVDFSHKFKPHSVTNYIFQKKKDIYNIDQQTLTTSRLSELNVFRNVPNPTYTKLPDSTNRLNTKIDITPLKQFSNRIEGEFLFNGGRFGYNLGNTFTDRNLFKNAAILQIKANWSVLFDNSNNSINTAAIQNQDLRLGASLIYPRLIVPFFTIPIFGKYSVPHTTLSTNYQLFYQKGLVSRESFINSITYDFFETSSKYHTFTPINFEFSKGTIDPQAQADLLQKNLFAYSYLIGRTIFTIGSQYTYQLNANHLNSYGNFTYFRGSLDVGGNTLNVLSKLFNSKRDTAGNRTFFGYPFAQYAKAEIDLRIYKSLGGERQFIFRISPGIGIPYGNSDDQHWIFEKEFYAGGANDMRAWLPRTLGPGQFNRATFYGTDAKADTVRTRLKYLDQFGEIKIIANAEYRYTLADNFFGAKLKGAFFVDAGNVWRLHKQDGDPNVEFRLNNILQSTAIGIGTGFRFDLAFFVFRLDAALKFKDPQFSGSDSWVLINHFNELFKSGDFKARYKAANSGDTYNFMQLNFGIGMPF
ncbi:BamA/TamA family outer membrane protein [Mucilaginibacter sp. BJC16-A38]|uniref:translocation and assembly module lipoprotein TamL n=1 Tax=Mucilaginibacter phenanthrenivorans TaxID=1234842 RepID=UPI002157B227|nr:BamA/TamA family outer membrane protein [Mucilaginibacter phenanthrenivorans]MCR8559767.1 BamA/TamA family outer membrane protein [Mucilaginibacter phenanthrenivorans]